MIYLSVKQKEKYVIELRKQGKTYREIAHEVKISPREISRILKKATGEIEEKERKKIVLSKTAQALQLYKKGKSPTDVAIKLDLSPQEANSLYHNFLYLNNLHHFVERFKEFNKNDSLQDLFDYYDFMKENGITKEEIVEAIKQSNDYPKIKEEYDVINDQLPELKRQRDLYISDNKFLISKNWELNNQNNSLVLKNESAKRKSQSMENEINKKRDLLVSIENSEDYTILKNKIEEQLNGFLNDKKEFFKLAAMIILDIIKRDPKKDILISNIINSNGDDDSQCFFESYEEKIAKIAADTLTENALEINTNNILN
jgi:DNA-binding CsgD family transcriptional regulator